MDSAHTRCAHTRYFLLSLSTLPRAQFHVTPCRLSKYVGSVCSACSGPTYSPVALHAGCMATLDLSEHALQEVAHNVRTKVTRPQNCTAEAEQPFPVVSMVPHHCLDALSRASSSHPSRGHLCSLEQRPGLLLRHGWGRPSTSGHHRADVGLAGHGCERCGPLSSCLIARGPCSSVLLSIRPWC